MVHDCAGGLITRIILPERDISSIRDARLDGPLIIDLRCREDSGLGVIVEPVKKGVARHKIVGR